MEFVTFSVFKLINTINKVIDTFYDSRKGIKKAFTPIN